MSRILTAFDSEVYPNYTLFAFKRVETGEVLQFEHFVDPDSGEPILKIDLPAFKRTLLESTLITFNGIGFDMPLALYAAIKKATAAEIYEATCRIIHDNMKWWNFEREFGVKVNDPKIDHIDLMEVAPLKGSLKVYAGRTHSPWMQDLPIAPGSIIRPEQLDELREYCVNDLNNTILLYKTLKVQIDLRTDMSKTYGIDLRSKSDAQIAEAVLKSEIEKITKKKVERPENTPAYFRYRVPAWVRFQHLDLVEDVASAEFQLDNQGRVVVPKELAEKKICIKNGVYRMGGGGLHSSEKCQIKLADWHHVIWDFDVTSYYPNIVLSCELYPPHIGKVFLSEYRRIVHERIEAKRAGRKVEAESKKIVANSAFGKMGSKWSCLFAPDLMVQVTVTGQLALLMLIETFWNIDGCEVISANTDGVTVRVRHDAQQDVLDAAETWELLTNFTLERADYEALYTRDVNNYIAVKTDGEVKTKGVYGTGLPLHKNPVAHICSTALIDYLTVGASIEHTVRLCRDIREFTVMRSVKGGALYNGQEIGKVVRWYYAKGVEEGFRYKVNNNLVATSTGARPLMRIDAYDQIPDDLNYDWYIQNTEKMLRTLEGLDEPDDE